MVYPIIWVITDDNGHWVRIQNKLKINNLRFHESKVPSARAAKGAVSDLIASLVPEGVDPGFKLDSVLPFTTLVKKLEELGLVKPVNISGKKAKPSDAADELTRAHKDNVRFYF